jgi:hypothetical protein
MATKQNPTPAHTIEGLPESWTDTPLLEGLSLVEKETLVGKLFRVTAVQQTVSESEAGYAMVRVEFELPDGTTGMFQDSSAKNGVRAEVEQILEKLGKRELLEEWVPLQFICPQGLRISEYKQPNNRGVMEERRTFYLTRSGKRA